MRIVAVLTAFCITVAAAPAFAAPGVSAKKDQAAKVKSEIDALDRRVEIAAEEYNEAAERHRDLSRQADETREELQRIHGRMDDLQGDLNARAAGMYRTGPMSFLEVLLGASDFEEFAAAWDVLTNVNRKDAEVVRELKVARAAAEKAEAKLDKAEAAAKRERDSMASRKRSIEKELAGRKSMLAGIEQEIAAIEKAERDRAAAAARQARARRQAELSSRGSSQPSSGRPKRSARGGVVDIAMRYLGTPYRWGASGPNAFDCSGFTMYVYAQVGVSLPHSSRAQYGCGERVSRANLQPGDLVFFGSPIHHVGIYVGGGDYIHAPRTGDVVKISSLSRSDYVGAVRP